MNQKVLTLKKNRPLEHSKNYKYSCLFFCTYVVILVSQRRGLEVVYNLIGGSNRKKKSFRTELVRSKALL